MEYPHRVIPLRQKHSERSASLWLTSHLIATFHLKNALFELTFSEDFILKPDRTWLYRQASLLYPLLTRTCLMTSLARSSFFFFQSLAYRPGCSSRCGVSLPHRRCCREALVGRRRSRTSCGSSEPDCGQSHCGRLFVLLPQY